MSDRSGGQGKVVGRIDLAGGRVFEAVIDDLLSQRVDGIVNAANGHLAHGGGVAAAIARAAGPALQEEGDRIVRERGPLATGEAVVTTAGRLPFKGVVHAVGPMQGDGDEEEKLARALKSACARAHENGWSSLAFPAVSSGIFAVPVDTCARAYLRAVREHVQETPGSSLRLIRLALLAGPMATAVAVAMEGAPR